MYRNIYIFLNSSFQLSNLLWISMGSEWERENIRVDADGFNILFNMVTGVVMFCLIDGWKN